MFSCGSNAGMETSAPLVSVNVNNALFHSNSHIHQRRLKSFTVCIFTGKFIAPDFVMKCRCSVTGILKVYMGLLHYGAFVLDAGNDAQNIRVYTARGKDDDQHNLSQMIMQYRSVCEGLRGFG